MSGVRVSFDRPYAKYPQVTDNPLSLGSGEFLLFEFPFAYWLEQHGYDVAYCSNSDMLTPERGLSVRSWVRARISAAISALTRSSSSTSPIASPPASAGPELPPS